MAKRKSSPSAPRKTKYRDTGTLALALSQEGHVEQYGLARQCMDLKRASFANGSLSQESIAAVREWAKRLASEAPSYLRPGAQLTFATDPDDCLTILERAVSWCAEKLYGVEGEGPFDDF